MIEPMDMPEGLYDDDVVCFLAERYNVSTRDVIRRFLVQERGEASPDGSVAEFILEDNEMEILRGLTRMRRYSDQEQVTSNKRWERT